MIITKQMLESKNIIGSNTFDSLFPNGLALNQDNIFRALDNDMHIAWFVEVTMNQAEAHVFYVKIEPYWSEYKNKAKKDSLEFSDHVKGFLAERDAAKKDAWAAYNKVVQREWEEFENKIAELKVPILHHDYTKNQEAIVRISDKYNKSEQSALRKFDKISKEAFEKCEKLIKPLSDKFDQKTKPHLDEYNHKVAQIFAEEFNSSLITTQAV